MAITVTPEIFPRYVSVFGSTILPKDERSRDDFEETFERFEVRRNDKVQDFPLVLLACVSLRFATVGGYKCEK